MFHEFFLREVITVYFLLFFQRMKQAKKKDKATYIKYS